MTFSIKLATPIASVLVNGSVLNRSSWGYVVFARGVLKCREIYSWDK